MRQAKKSTAEKRAARRFGEFARSVRRNLRQAHRVLERAEETARRCYGKAGAAMLDAKISSGMSEEGFAAWLAPFELSQDRFVQCLELGQVALDRRKAEAAEREECFAKIMADKRDMSREAVGREEEQRGGQREESARRRQELTQ
jgi:hypothetical protein